MTAKETNDSANADAAPAAYELTEPERDCSRQHEFRCSSAVNKTSSPLNATSAGKDDAALFADKLAVLDGGPSGQRCYIVRSAKQ